MILDEGTGLGDIIARAAGVVGITEERLTAFLGVPCGCDARREKLNQLGGWAARIVRGKIERASEYLDKIVGGWE